MNPPLISADLAAPSRCRLHRQGMQAAPASVSRSIVSEFTQNSFQLVSLCLF